MAGNLNLNVPLRDGHPLKGGVIFFGGKQPGYLGKLPTNAETYPDKESAKESKEQAVFSTTTSPEVTEESKES